MTAVLNSEMNFYDERKIRRSKTMSRYYKATRPRVSLTLNDRWINENRSQQQLHKLCSVDYYQECCTRRSGRARGRAAAGSAVQLSADNKSNKRCLRMLMSQ